MAPQENTTDCPLQKSLPEIIKQIAEEELRENDAIKENALISLKTWLEKSGDVLNCRTDRNFLLRFLRAKKFSLPLTQQLLMKYLNLRQKFRHLLQHLDVDQPSMQELMKAGYIYPSPIRDQDGRRVIITAGRKFDPRKYTAYDMAKIHMMTYEACLEEEETQIAGFVHIIDAAGVSASHVTLWQPTEFATIIKWGEQSIPMRHKAVHIINLPTPLRYVCEFAKGRLSDKIKQRFKVHESLESLRKEVDASVLPEEYGGKISTPDMIETWQNTLKSKKKVLLELDEMVLLSDENIITKKNTGIQKFNCTSLDGVMGSFRKLEID